MVLPVRLERKQRRILSAAGNEILSDTNIMSVDEVKVGDLIAPRDLSRENLTPSDLTENDYWPIQAVEDVGPDVGGNVLGYKAFL